MNSDAIIVQIIPFSCRFNLCLWVSRASKCTGTRDSTAAKKLELVQTRQELEAPEAALGAARDEVASMGDYKTDWWWNHVGKYQGDKGKKDGS